MILPTGVATATQRLPLLSARALPFLYLRGVPKLGFVSFLHQNRMLTLGVSNKMAQSMEKCDVGIENTLGVVRPATEEYAEEAMEALKAGKVIAVPTDTLYGFACDACSLQAVNRIYEIKGRKHTSPLAICVGDVSDIKRFAITDHLPHRLLDSLLPGPVTVILRRGSALALTSANLSGQPSSVCIKDFENQWQHCALVYDGGVLPSGRAGSTIVDLTGPGKFKILRPGSAKDETIGILESHSLLEEATVT
ncbi:yrdC domain-containing protein, mitochondrial isoform X2 [Carya illinoinensis]|uniref:yrdC domain-containing protein, mitochondrial isoform X2 n=1 Tax=Carya illinoinensis TaxID=32201 RepID=UPI001C71F64A|nr:yrdC domain-containing protein, mitochondrial isoform X2 [Carya illinoinensis]